MRSSVHSEYSLLRIISIRIFGMCWVMIDLWQCENDDCGTTRGGYLADLEALPFLQLKVVC